MSLWSALRDVRYAMPGVVGARLPAPDAAWAARRAGPSACFAYFHTGDAPPDAVLAAHLALAQALRGSGAGLAVKAPALGFCPNRMGALVATGVPLLLDAHAPGQADATLDLAGRFPGMGLAIPARWRRSVADAARLRDTRAPLRLVKGEWADPDSDPPDLRHACLDLVRLLAGRRAPVIVASHDPALVGPALDLLIAAGTPCLLEQLRGLPRRRTMALAQARGVAVRVYHPTGPGWWPYAIDKALARPYLPGWWWRDRRGVPDPSWSDA
jgi:proline dehydrogenase